ncbi:ABC transporter ATP-binding protein [Lachnospiraceae bacterium MD1]|uniref:ABC transporter ATP-binding protein n=1 Tax=Variimorphobacter saccharofermentans TaxID=2755051 RepID=A0A839K2B7_9FIRM|nr:ABC transporter ATP-binding protein [Variimorphobacter saccharofermentans]MBB2183538.1 ABC transporter ATP-binding protein [Variimorphobacter saccharofermentans]
MKSMNNRFFNNVHGASYIMMLCWTLNKKRVVLEFLRSLLDYGERIVYGIYFFKIIFFLIEKKAGFSEIIGIDLIAMGILAVVTLFNKWFDIWYTPISNNEISGKLNLKIFKKSAEVDLECYEDTNFYNTIMLSSEQANEKVTSAMQNIIKLYTSMLASIFVIIYIFTINRTNVLFLLCPVVGLVFVAKKVNKMYYLRYVNSLPFYRVIDYVNRIMSLENYSKEVKLTNIFEVMQAKYTEAYKGIKKVAKDCALKVISLNVTQCMLVFVFFSNGILLYNAYCTSITKTISFYNFIVLANAIGSLAWIIVDTLNFIGKMSDNALCGNNLKHFFEYENKVVNNEYSVSPEKESDTIRIKNLFFTYKNADEPVLKNINMEINKNEKIAIVGENGSGKSTLIKLILRLYDAQEGEILYNNKNIKSYKINEYRKLFTTAFQDFQVFSLTIAENILNREIKNQDDYTKVEKALCKSGMNEYTQTLKKKYDSVLTREFAEDGEVLSGGQNQKLAIARAYANDFSIGIFDEPSSALDPIAESQVYKSIMDTCSDKMLILVSHRLSSVIDVDKIYMMENGEIIESGCHDELIKLDGKYAKMYMNQAKSYQE